MSAPPLQRTVGQPAQLAGGVGGTGGTRSGGATRFDALDASGPHDDVGAGGDEGFGGRAADAGGGAGDGDDGPGEVTGLHEGHARRR